MTAPVSHHELVRHAIEVLSDIEVAVRFYRPDLQDCEVIRQLVLWMKTGLPAYQFAPTQDGKSLYEVAEYVLQMSNLDTPTLVDYAIERMGFSEEGTGVSYYDQNDDALENNLVVLSYWVGGFSQVLMPESVYLEALKAFLYDNEKYELIAHLLKQHPFDVKLDSQDQQIAALGEYLPQLRTSLHLLEDTDITSLLKQLDSLEESLNQLQTPPVIPTQFGHIGSFELW